MRLFLTATSERGKPVTKSGNEKIRAIYNNEKREEIITTEIYENMFVVSKAGKILFATSIK